MGTAALICAAGCQKTASMRMAQALGDAEGKVLKTHEDVKALFPDAEWLESQQAEARFMFCANYLPSYGSSKIDIHAWAFRRHSNQWESVFAVQLNGVGRVTLSIDPKTGLFSAKGSANNQFLDKSVFTFDLRATEM